MVYVGKVFLEIEWYIGFQECEGPKPLTVLMDHNGDEGDDARHNGQF
jgi:hypothetical protein